MMLIWILLKEIDSASHKKNQPQKETKKTVKSISTT